MTGDGQIEAMADITDAVFQAELNAMRRLSEEEATLRQAISDLDEQAAIAVISAADHPEMRAIGADQLWRGWLIRRRVALQAQLAGVLARKTNAAQRLNIAFGRAAVTKDLFDQSLVAAQTRRRDRFSSKLMESYAWPNPAQCKHT